MEKRMFHELWMKAIMPRKALCCAIIVILMLMSMNQGIGFRQSILKSKHPRTKHMHIYAFISSSTGVRAYNSRLAAGNTVFRSQDTFEQFTLDTSLLSGDVEEMSFTKLSTLLWQLARNEKPPKSAIPANVMARIDDLSQDQRIDYVDLFRAMNAFVKIGFSWKELPRNFQTSFLYIIFDISKTTRMHRELASYVYLLGRSGMSISAFPPNILQLMLSAIEANIGTMYGQCVANLLNGMGKIAMTWDRLSPSLTRSIINRLGDVIPTMKGYELSGSLFSLALMKVTISRHLSLCHNH
jgi:hypothetical protein